METTTDAQIAELKAATEEGYIVIRKLTDLISGLQTDGVASHVAPELRRWTETLVDSKVNEMGVKLTKIVLMSSSELLGTLESLRRLVKRGGCNGSCNGR